MTALGAALVSGGQSLAQERSIASTMDVYLFPADGQAAPGAIRGRRMGRQAQAEAQQQAEASGAERSAATEDQLENFKKAFSVCPEGKDYPVRY